MFVDRIFPGIATAGTIVGIAFTIMGQSVFDPFANTTERWVGGSLLMAAAFLIVRWTRALLKDVQEIRDKENDAALEREKLLLQQINDMTAQQSELNAQLNRERELRLSLEQMGLQDRRTPPRLDST